MRVENARRGYTLIELIVTVMIIGILTGIAVPQYLKSVETGKADDAVATLNMIGTTSRMYALDHAGANVADGTFAAACGVAACPQNKVCDLVYCKYLADQDWASKPYAFKVTGGLASAARCAGASPCTNNAPYNGWSYAMSASGQITAGGGAPAPTY